MKASKPEKPPKRKGLDRPRHLTGQRGGHHNLLREAVEEAQDVVEGPEGPVRDEIWDSTIDFLFDDSISFEDVLKKEEK